MGSPDTVVGALGGKPNVTNLDLDAELPGTDDPHASTLVSKPYDPLPHEDEARRTIAYLLIWLLIGICIATFATLWAKALPVADLVRILEILLGPIVALVSAATGFYYGTKATNRHPK
ncbi:MULTISPECIES: hypothetical protein [Achromobacter]|uniref:hypothetical protein n=1 Tax=Achromobacter TaxID=222 RepID=UPI0025BE5F01|nr:MULTISPECIES: hypothetical protein [Achromobacter]